MATNHEPKFDGVAFAAWLRRWKDAHDLEWSEIAKACGLHDSTLKQLANGKPQKGARDRGQTEINPAINTLARLANGLGLPFAFVASKGGIYGGGVGRWDHFTEVERAVIESALLNPMFNTPGVWDEERKALLNDIQQTESTLEVPA